MNFIKIIIGISLFFWCPLEINAQYIIPDFQTQIVQKDELWLRWEPRSMAEWQASLKQAYRIKVYEGIDNNNMVLTKEETIQPMPLADWEKTNEAVKDSFLLPFYEGAKNLVYTDAEVEKELMQMLSKEEGKSLQQTTTEFRLGYLAYTITYDFDLMKIAGLAYALSFEKDKKYKIEVQTGTYAPYIFEFDPQKIQAKKVPVLKAIFDDKKVNLEWETRSFKKDYYGYYLEWSRDGKNYEDISAMPYVNLFDTIPDQVELHSLRQEIPLSANYKEYWIRLKGMNYFGLRSKRTSAVKGHGFDIIPAMPSIIHADQTLDNKADLKWKLEKKFNRLIQHFQVFRADSLEGHYTSVMDSIPASSRSIQIPMTEKRNYFSIGLVPKEGKIIRSLPTFVMGQDTVPPITPQNFEGKMDSLGIVTLTWSPNTEDDLWGYKVFRSEYINDEFASLHSSPMNDTLFMDTINLNSFNEEIHYYVMSLDTRNNRSPFSKIISLERPDTIPPTPPLIKSAKFLEDSIQVTWAASSSQDAVLHQLFRKEMGQAAWELIAEQDSVASLNYLTDKNFQPDKVYAYTVIAMDDDSLSSRPSRPLQVQTKSNKPKAAFENFEVTFDETQQNATITWTLKDNTALHQIMVYRGKSKDNISMYDILEGTTTSIQQKVKEKESWFFIFNPVFEDESLARMSEIIRINIPD